MARVAIVFCLLLAVVAAAPKKKKSSAIAGRIIGGKITDINYVPYQVSVQFNNEHRCGGSIIGEKYILTAAHCVRNGTESDYTIRAGSKHHAKKGEIRKVKKIKTHPDYVVRTADNDIALLELGRPLQLKKNTKSQSIELTEKEPKTGEKILVSGWGVLVEGGTAARSLTSVNITVIDRKICKEKHKNRNNVTENMFCAGETEGGKDACTGDSGGPAVLDERLAGIVSWGKGCGRKDAPGVYTNVFKYREWITTETSSKE